MIKWSETNEATAFIHTGATRETSTEIMEAIAFFAKTLDEAESLWRGDGFGTICHPADIWEHVTKNGLRDASEFCWGSSGTTWWPAIEDAGY
jgi:hypothetical protein